MIELLNRVLFWSGAKNRHGIHSPFVYDFLDRSLYAPENRDASPSERLLLAAIRHFNPGRIGCEAGSQWAQRLVTTETESRETAPPYDFYVFDRPGPELLAWIGDRENWHNDTVLFVDGLGPGGRATPFWRDCMELEAVRVCLETYPSALLFFRREQAPQHFRIRI